MAEADGLGVAGKALEMGMGEECHMGWQAGSRTAFVPFRDGLGAGVGLAGVN